MTATDLAWIMDDLDELDVIDDSHGVDVIMKSIRILKRFLWATAYWPRPVC